MTVSDKSIVVPKLLCDGPDRQTKEDIASLKPLPSPRLHITNRSPREVGKNGISEVRGASRPHDTKGRLESVQKVTRSKLAERRGGRMLGRRTRQVRSSLTVPTWETKARRVNRMRVGRGYRRLCFRRDRGLIRASRKRIVVTWLWPPPGDRAQSPGWIDIYLFQSAGKSRSLTMTTPLPSSFSTQVTLQHPHEVGQIMSFFPKRTQRRFLKRPTSESEQNSCSWTSFDQLIDDLPRKLAA